MQAMGGTCLEHVTWPWLGEEHLTLIFKRSKPYQLAALGDLNTLILAMGCEAIRNMEIARCLPRTRHNVPEPGILDRC